MKITLKLYATLGHLLPAHRDGNVAQIEVDDDSTIEAIVATYQVPPELVHLVLINGVYVQPEERSVPGKLQEGDALAIWPPVAGG